MKSERQKRLDWHHNARKRERSHKIIAILGSMLVLSIPVYVLYFA